MQKAYEFDFVYDTQAAFRLLLEALSNPGRIVELGPLARKLGGAYAMTLTVAAVLLDNEVSFAVCGSPALAEKITELTLAKTAAVSKADYIFVYRLLSAVHCAILIKARLSFCAQRICRQASCSGSAGPGSRLSRKSLCARNCRRLWINVMSRNMSIRWDLIFLCWISGAA